MEITLLDDDGNRYDPELADTLRKPSRDILVLQHDEPVSFSHGDRAEIILASDTYEEKELSEMVKPRKEVKTVLGSCEAVLSERTTCWEIFQRDAVDDVLDADSHFQITDFD